MDIAAPETIETPDGETARQVPGWSDYFVDRSGGVWSTKRRTLRRLRQATNALGYRHVKLSDGVRRKNGWVHRLVLAAWDRPRPKGMQCRHLDGDPSNNALSNLRWGTPLQNSDDKRRHGTEGFKLSQDDVRAILGDAESTHVELAERFNVSPGMVMRIRQGLKWRHVERDPDAPVYESGRAELTEDDVRRIRFHTDGLKLSEIASRFATTKSNVSRIKRGITWAHVTA